MKKTLGFDEYIIGRHHGKIITRKTVKEHYKAFTVEFPNDSLTGSPMWEDVFLSFIEGESARETAARYSVCRQEIFKMREEILEMMFPGIRIA